MNNKVERRDAPAQQAAPWSNVRELRLFVFALFFIFGGITSLNDVLIPKLKGLFTLTYAEVMLVQTAFFAAYFLISIPGAEIVRALKAEGVATILVEQRVEAALAIADRVAFIENGVARETATPSALRADPALLHRYVGVGLRGR